MKKAFTLVEMVIVIMIISILLGALSFLSWSYISQLNVQNEKETILNSFFYTQTMSLSQPSIGNIKNINFIGIKLSPDKKYIQEVASTGDITSLNPFSTGIKPFGYIKMGTGVDLYTGNTLNKNITNNSYVLYKPYTMGATFVEENAGTYTIYTGNYNIKFKFISIYNDDLCFKLNLASGRLYSEKCN